MAFPIVIVLMLMLVLVLVLVLDRAGGGPDRKLSTLAWGTAPFPSFPSSSLGTPRARKLCFLDARRPICGRRSWSF